MLAEPNGVEAEAFRMLRTNLEFANLERDAHAIMVTSALEAEGKSTTVANLALALARTGKRVVLVDLDLRRPYLDRFFDLGERPGLTDVALGRVSLERALTPLAITEPRGDEAEPEKEHTEDGHENGNGNGNGNRKSTPRARGMLEVLPSGPIPPDTGEFVGSQKLAGILDKLRKRADVVLIDAPPLLHVGDAMTLSARVDALLVVCRLNVVRRPVLNELARVLEACPAPTLGYAAAGVEADEEYGSTYGGYYYQRRSRQPQTESVR
jgi:non-specific protein-tyrosine kinase